MRRSELAHGRLNSGPLAVTTSSPVAAMSGEIIFATHGTVADQVASCGPVLACGREFLDNSGIPADIDHNDR